MAQITVPDVKGLDAEKAKQAIKDKGLVPSAGTPAYSDTVEKGLVISTNPESGTKVEKNSTVEYIVSLGSEGVEVPNVVGQREGAAVAMLNDAGFSVTTDYANSDTVAEGLVISQSPSAGEKGKEGGTVNIVVSSGKAKPTKFTVSASVSGEGGYVSPSSMEVDEGGSITFQVTPNSGYTVSSVTDTNGNSYSVSPSGGSFTVSNVKNSIAVTVVFAKQSTPDPTPTPNPTN